MTFAFSWVAIIGGLALLFLGAEALVRGSVAIAFRLGASPLAIGLTVVAFGTSSPELVVSLDAGFKGQGALAVGNVVGSNIANLALILGLAALIRPLQVQARLIRIDIPIAIGCSVVLGLMLLDGTVRRLEGGLLLLGMLAYLLHTIRMIPRASRDAPDALHDVLPKVRGNLPLNVGLAGAGLGMLVLGAELLVDGAVDIAQRFGLSEAAIGLTVVAVGTSLPELATSTVAAYRRQGDLAIGNVVGSNIFNILGILGPAALLAPLRTTGIASTDVGLMIGLSVLMLPLMRSGFRLSRWEGCLLLSSYGAYLWFLLLRTA